MCALHILMGSSMTCYLLKKSVIYILRVIRIEQNKIKYVFPVLLNMTA